MPCQFETISFDMYTIKSTGTFVSYERAAGLSPYENHKFVRSTECLSDIYHCSKLRKTKCSLLSISCCFNIEHKVLYTGSSSGILFCFVLTGKCCYCLGNKSFRCNNHLGCD